MTWGQVECNADITNIFYIHTSRVCSSELTLREQVEVFLDKFIKGYHGSSDIVDILHSLISYARQEARCPIKAGVAEM